VQEEAPRPKKRRKATAAAPAKKTAALGDAKRDAARRAYFAKKAKKRKGRG